MSSTGWNSTDAAPSYSRSTERDEKASVAIASNESFSGWKTFTDPRLCAAIVDQLTVNGTIIETGATFYSARLRLQQATA